MNPANNPANFAQPMPFGPRPHAPIQQNPQRNATNPLLVQIVQNLQKQGPFTGWRAEVGLAERVHRVSLL